jgi:hypothetical protein
MKKKKNYNFFFYFYIGVSNLERLIYKSFTVGWGEI